MKAEELQELQQELETVLNQIQEYDSTFRLTQEVQPITFAEIQQLATEEQTAFIECYITAEKFVTFVILPPTSTADSKLFIWQSTEDDLKNLKEWVNEYLTKYYEIQEAYLQREENLDKYENLQQEWETNITTRLEKLGEILHINEIIQPILERKCERLTLVPHSFLHLLPLHALVINPENSKENPDKIYLQDYFYRGIRYAPSCQILQKVRQRQCQYFQSIFAIQTPTEDLYELDLSVVSAIKEQFDEAEILKKNLATRSAVIKHPKLSVANSILFFCHGKFNFNSPLDSGLQLADEKLTLADIIQYLNLKNCHLVTLAACETGLTDQKSRICRFTQWFSLSWKYKYCC